MHGGHGVLLTVVDEAIALLAVRDVVYLDVEEMEWTCRIPPKATIQTHFGQVRCN